jgi:anti-anti-sigma factor
MVLHAEGALDERTLDEFKEKITAIPESGIDLVLGLAGVTRVDAGGVTALIAGVKSAERAGTRIAVAEPSSTVMRVLETVRLDEAFETFGSEGEALSALATRRQGTGRRAAGAAKPETVRGR